MKGKECTVCHNEHHGRYFKLIKFDKNTFNHSETGFLLTGKHSNTKCEDCHTQKNINIDRLKSRKETYLGLGQTCISCHEDYHQATLSSDCKTCHNITSFKPAVFFDHKNAGFKLTGAHISLNCAKCHPREKRNGKDFVKFTGISFQNCTPCHTDIHSGKFGTDCKKCHSTDTFKRVFSDKFNHNLANFPLTGKHTSVECSSCHKNGIQVKVKFDKCSNCHKDFHKGEFSASNISIDCSDCHTTDGFTPSLFTIGDHNKTKFILAGSHLAVPCRDCHFSDNNWKFKFADVNCITCHKNIHGNEISQKFIGDNNCSTCHNESSWHNISFDHKKTGFNLEGKHKNLLCGSCHTNKLNTSIKYIFASMQNECESCHPDIHSGQFKTDGKTNCSKCHIPEGWGNSTFDHNYTNFPLSGAHKNLECSKCHKSIVAENSVKYKIYKIGKSKCSDCHS